MKDRHLNVLLNKIKDNDDEAFEELYKVYYKRVFYFALQLSKNEQDAQDITQETFIQLRKSIVTLQDNKAFSVWLHRIIISKAGGLFRKNKTVSLPDDHFLFKNVNEKRNYMLPIDSVHVQLDKEMMECFINSLDEKYRLVIVLSYFSNFKIKEIADILKIPEGTVKSRMNTGKELLKKKIEYYQEHEGVLLNFKTEDMAGVLTAFFVAKTSEGVITKSILLLALKKLKSLGNEIATHVAVTSMIVISGMTITYGVFQSYEASKQHEVSNKVINAAAPDFNFSKVYYQGKLYENAEDAYYALTNWAHCEIEMNAYNSQEKQEIQELYNALKQQGGVYWGMLKENNWDEKFHERLK